jgi:ABC-type dipeptide/oligopeptide/nickel transport system ATPase component
MTKLLTVNNLVTHFNTESGLVKANDGVSYYLDEMEIIGMVGESGCGKSVSQLSVMQLIRPPGQIIGGEVIFEGKNLLEYEANGPEMRSVRGGKIAMIFQEPMTSLNPVLTIGFQLTPKRYSATRCTRTRSGCSSASRGWTRKKAPSWYQSRGCRPT